MAEKGALREKGALLQRMRHIGGTNKDKGKKGDTITEKWAQRGHYYRKGGITIEKQAQRGHYY